MRKQGAYIIGAIGVAVTLCCAIVFYPRKHVVDTAFVRADTYIVSAAQAGEITLLNCQEGEAVSVGHIAARLHSPRIQQELLDTTLRLQQAKETLDGLRDEQTRWQTRVLDNDVLQRVLDQQRQLAETRYHAMKANVAASEEERTEAALRWKALNVKLQREVASQREAEQHVAHLHRAIMHAEAILDTRQNQQKAIVQQQRALQRATPVSLVWMQRFVEVGAFVDASTPLCKGIVPGSFWVDAYLTSSQIKELEIGTPVAVHVGDSSAPRQGYIERLSWATGAALAPDTPNYTSGHVLPLVQRTPVRIRLPYNEQEALRVGQRVKVIL